MQTELRYWHDSQTDGFSIIVDNTNDLLNNVDDDDNCMHLHIYDE